MSDVVNNSNIDWLQGDTTYIALSEASQYCLIIAHLYPKIINFDAVDFSECCSEEVTSFFWCSLDYDGYRYYSWIAFIVKEYIFFVINDIRNIFCGTHDCERRGLLNKTFTGENRRLFKPEFFANGKGNGKFMLTGVYRFLPEFFLW